MLSCAIDGFESDGRDHFSGGSLIADKEEGAGSEYVY